MGLVYGPSEVEPGSCNYRFPSGCYNGFLKGEYEHLGFRVRVSSFGCTLQCFTVEA